MQKQKPKTKEELEKEIKNKQNIDRLRKLTKEVILPIMIDVSTDIEHAKIVAQSTQIAIDRGFGLKQKEFKVADLGLIDQLNGSDESEKFKKLLEALKDESIYDASFIFNEFSTAIDNILRKELKNRKLSELNLDLDVHEN